MINKLQWVAITRVRRAGTLWFALALALLAAPAAYGADGNPGISTSTAPARQGRTP